MKEKADGRGPHDVVYVERVPRAERWSFPSRGAVRSPDPRCFFPHAIAVRCFFFFAWCGALEPSVVTTRP